MIVAIPFAYTLGLLPALLTGAGYALVPNAWPRLWLSPLLGGVATLLVILAPFLLARGNIPAINSPVGLMPWCGAVAAIVCAAIVERPSE